MAQLYSSHVARTVGEMIAVARQESGVWKLEGHDIMALERFDPEVAHMIVFDVVSSKSPIGDRGERMRLFLTETGYRKVLENRGRSFIKILNIYSMTNWMESYKKRLIWQNVCLSDNYPKSYKFIDSRKQVFFCIK